MALHKLSHTKITETFYPEVNKIFLIVSYCKYQLEMFKIMSTNSSYILQSTFQSFLQVNSEFYVGWLDHWGTPHEMVDSTPLAKSLDKLLAYGANINM